MMDFIKTCGIGLLYLLLSPVILAIFAMFIAFTALSFLFTFFKAVFIFFKGKSIFDKTPEEIEAERILESRKIVVSPQQLQYQSLMQPQSQVDSQHPMINQISNVGGERND